MAIVNQPWSDPYQAYCDAINTRHSLRPNPDSIHVLASKVDYLIDRMKSVEASQRLIVDELSLRPTLSPEEDLIMELGRKTLETKKRVAAVGSQRVAKDAEETDRQWREYREAMQAHALALQAFKEAVTGETGEIIKALEWTAAKS